MTFIFRNRTIFWDILKWNRGQTKWDGESIKIHWEFQTYDIFLLENQIDGNIILKSVCLLKKSLMSNFILIVN